MVEGNWKNSDVYVYTYVRASVRPLGYTYVASLFIDL